MTPQEIKEGNALIAEFLGYKYYKKVLVDFSDCGGIYDWTDVYSKVPIEVDDYPEDEQCYIKDDWYEDNYKNYIYNPAYHEDWNQLMKVVEVIENLDLKEEGYSWNDEEGTHYNFMCISIDIERNSCWICVELQLDPPYTISHIRTDSKQEAVYKAVVEFVKYYKTKNSEK